MPPELAELVAQLPAVLQAFARDVRQLAGSAEFSAWVEKNTTPPLTPQVLGVELGTLVLRAQGNPYAAAADMLELLLLTEDVVVKFRAEGDMAVELDPGVLERRLVRLRQLARTWGTGGTGVAPVPAASIVVGTTGPAVFRLTRPEPLGESEDAATDWRAL